MISQIVAGYEIVVGVVTITGGSTDERDPISGSRGGRAEGDGGSRERGQAQLLERRKNGDRTDVLFHGLICDGRT